MKPKTLVVYYSRTGITKKLASAIAQHLNADIEEIIDTHKRSWLIGYIKAWRDAALKRQTDIQPLTSNISKYSLVCIGTPVWDFSLATAIRTFLTIYEKKLPSALVFFCTQASAWAQGTFQEMASIANKKPILTICYTSKEIRSDMYQVSLRKQLSSCEI